MTEKKPVAVAPPPFRGNEMSKPRKGDGAILHSHEERSILASLSQNELIEELGLLKQQVRMKHRGMALCISRSHRSYLYTNSHWLLFQFSLIPSTLKSTPHRSQSLVFHLTGYHCTSPGSLLALHVHLLPVVMHLNGHTCIAIGPKCNRTYSFRTISVGHYGTSATFYLANRPLYYWG